MAIWTWRKGTFSPREWGWQSPFNPPAAGLPRAVGGREPSWGPGTVLGHVAMPMGLGPRAGLLARAHLPGPRCPRPFKAVLLRRAALQATWGTSAGAHRPPLEAAEILCGSAALSRPGNDRPPPGGRAP